MRFSEINVFGVYIAPISAMILAAWAFTIGLRRIASQIGLFRWVWHPALFVFSVYIIVLSCCVLIVASRS